jgi:cytochrome c oxidase subunit IV
MTEHASHPVAEHHQHHIVTPRVYLLIFGALMLGTGLTVGASYIDMGEWNPVIALAIACTKAVLVILFFMHIKYSSRVMKLTVASGFFTFLVLITMTLSDYISRAWGLW